MNFEYKSTIPAHFHNLSRIWIYQSSRQFQINESIEIERRIARFVEQWNSHGVPVKGFSALLFNQFIILVADETGTGVSGCSTDSSVRLIKDIEQMFNVNLFDRQMLAFIIKDKVQLLPLGQLKYAADNHFISANTLYFNNLVQTKLDFESNWIIPIKDSWLVKKVSFPESVS
jgi:hypothetical protein